MANGRGNIPLLFIVAHFSAKWRIAIRLGIVTLAVRETRISRHNGGPIKGPHNPPLYDSPVMYGWFQGDHQLGPHDAEKRQTLG